MRGDIAEVVQAFRQEDITECIAEQIVDEVAPHIQELLVEVPLDLSPEQVQPRTMEQLSTSPRRRFWEQSPAPWSRLCRRTHAADRGTNR